MNVLFRLFTVFFRIGAFTIGGGYAMLPLIERDIVTRNKWIDRDEYFDMVVVSQSAPGLLAMNISILVGNKVAGKKGAFISAFASALPSFIIIILFAMFFDYFQDNEIIEKVFRALRPAVVALIAVPLFNMTKSAKLNVYTAFLPILTVFLICYMEMSPIPIIFVSAISGILIHYYILKRRKNIEQ